MCNNDYAFNEENEALPMVLYCSDMIYKYYSHLRFVSIKHNEEGKNPQ